MMTYGPADFRTGQLVPMATYFSRVTGPVALLLLMLFATCHFLMHP